MKYIEDIKEIIAKFAEDVKAFYSKEDIDRGYITAKDRDGTVKNFDLLSVSASVVIVKAKTKKDTEDINAILSLQKKCAKKELGKICISTII
jgi:hypothetical protein